MNFQLLEKYLSNYNIIMKKNFYHINKHKYVNYFSKTFYKCDISKTFKFLFFRFNLINKKIMNKKLLDKIYGEQKWWIIIFIGKNNIDKCDSLSFNITKKDEKTITYTITVKKDTNIITKSYKNRLIPYAKRKGFNKKSLENLKYKNKHNDFFMNVNFNADSLEK